jgi:hypothetical protein
MVITRVFHNAIRLANWRGGARHLRMRAFRSRIDQLENPYGFSEAEFAARSTHSASGSEVVDLPNGARIFAIWHRT